VHRCLYRANPVNSYVGWHFHWRAIHGDPEIDDPGVLFAAERLRRQSSGGDVGDGVPRCAPRWRRAPLCGWGRRSLTDAAGEHEQHDEDGRLRGPRAPPTAQHGSRIERTKMSPVPRRAAATRTLVHCHSALHRAWLANTGRAPVAQGIEHRPPEAGARVRISPGAQVIALVSRYFWERANSPPPLHDTFLTHLPALARAPRPLHRPQRRAGLRRDGRIGPASSPRSCGRASAAPP
jgi:hypothetical protein